MVGWSAGRWSAPGASAGGRAAPSSRVGPLSSATATRLLSAEVGAITQTQTATDPSPLNAVPPPPLRRSALAATAFRRARRPRRAAIEVAVVVVVVSVISELGVAVGTEKYIFMDII